ncbi:hypothetical protein [Desulfosporosinus lacus]|uniref:Uncharacterized protein n=1 Tax=Desulfosporosinus lacus DSM 15449 TaxID=1121420 RepID=A0A1M5S728_9FIRM|nr:hypothetical protein [Desulfosporosinus lacus]SHH34289.1 hypothetical protein SAMN02746098_00764 [Desulfosporosinus lacus DSM 15449]
MLSIGAPVVFAQETPASVITPQSSVVNFNFSVTYAGDVKYSSGYKNDYTTADVYVQGGTMQSGDSIGFGLYDSNKNPIYVTAYTCHNIPDTFSLSYKDAKPGSYYLGARKGIAGYSGTCSISGKWYP